MFDKEGGRIIFFEGTYTTTFSGNPDPTPRYDYNQVMYQLDLSDPRLALPVAIYRRSVRARRLPRDWSRRPSPADREKHAAAARRVLRAGPGGDRVAAGVRAIRPREGSDLACAGTGDRRRMAPAPGRCFSSFPPTSRTTRRRRSRFTNTARKGAAGRFYSVDAPSPNARSRWTPSCSAASGETRRVRGCGEVTQSGVGRSRLRSRDSGRTRWITVPIRWLAANRTRSDGRSPSLRETSWLGEIADQLESDPQECWQALEGLASVEPELRLSIIDELSRLGLRPGVGMLLRLLSSARDPATRQRPLRSSSDRRRGIASSFDSHCAVDRSRTRRPRRLPGRADRRAVSTRAGGCRAIGDRGWHRCLVTPVDGQGRGSIVVSVNQAAQRRTAAFLCDVRLGIRDVVGEVEPESPRAGGLIDALIQQPGIDCARDVPELALGLLAGSLMLCGPAVPPAGARLARRNARARVPAGRLAGDDPRPGPVVDSPRGDAADGPRRARRLPFLAGCLAADLRAGRGNLAP